MSRADKLIRDLCGIIVIASVVACTVAAIEGMSVGTGATITAILAGIWCLAVVVWLRWGS